MKQIRQSSFYFFFLVLSIFFSHPLAGLAQLTPVGSNLTVQSAASTTAGEPRVAVAENGITAVVWEQGTANEDVFLRLYHKSAAPLTASMQVNTTIASDQREPDIAVQTRQALFAVVWESMNQANASSGLDIVLRIYDSTGAAVTSEIPVNDIASGNQKNPRVEIDQNSGTILVVWQSDLTGIYGIYARRFSLQGVSMGEDQLIAQMNEDCVHPELAIGPSGKSVIAWEQGSRNRRTVSFKRFHADGSAMDTTPQSVGNPCLPYGHDVEMLGSDQIVFAMALDGAIHCSLISDTGKELLNQAVPNAGGKSPKLAALGRNHFVLTWTGQNHTIQSTVYSIESSTFSDAVSVSSISPWNELSAIACNRDRGKIGVVWEASHASEGLGAIHAQLYTGNVPLPLFQTNVMEITPRTGDLARMGNQVEKGITQAFSDMDLASKSISLIVNDNQSAVTKSAELAQTAITDSSYLAILGAVASKNTMAIAQENQNAADPLVQFTFSSSQQLDTMPRLVKVAPLDDYQVDVMASVLAYNGLSKIFLLVENSTYGLGFERLKNKTGIQVVEELVFQSGALDASQVIARMASAIAAGAQVGVMAGYDTDARTLLQALATQTDASLRNFSWIFSDAITTDSVLQGLPFDRTLFYHPVIMGLTPSITNQLQTSIQFKAAYQAANNGEIPEWPAYYAYDTVAAFNAMLNASASQTRADLWATVSGLRFEGVTGAKWLDDKGSLQSAIYDVNYVILGKFHIIGEDRVKQPDSAGGGAAKSATRSTPLTVNDSLIYDNFVYELAGDNPLISHAAGGPDGNGNWVAQSRDMELGWVLVAYYEDAHRKLTTDGKAFGFKDGNHYTLQFVLSRENLSSPQPNGAILEIEVSSHSQLSDGEGQSGYISQVLENTIISFSDWATPGPLLVQIPFLYESQAPDWYPPEYANDLLNWELRLLNSAHQKLTLSSVTILAGDHTSIGDFILY
ncbi:MAG: amino acid ABC transporter substrate-binding protein [Candidatus Omnitrophota bacterium]|jgi:branched-chain amino acid transport system substrate-binding protein|nr:MAG: amino acid ABC transporter substrate-binding protein [Candidatus Omnitrophota bacterium]